MMNKLWHWNIYSIGQLKTEKRKMSDFISRNLYDKNFVLRNYMEFKSSNRTLSQARLVANMTQSLCFWMLQKLPFTFDYLLNNLLLISCVSKYISTHITIFSYIHLFICKRISINIVFVYLSLCSESIAEKSNVRKKNYLMS